MGGTVVVACLDAISRSVLLCVALAYVSTFLFVLDLKSKLYQQAFMIEILKTGRVEVGPR